MSGRLTRSRPRAGLGSVVLIPLILVAALVVWTSPTAEAATSTSYHQPPGTSSVIADLEEYVPTQLEVVGVPGLAIALIRDGRITWEEAYGVANTCTGEPLTEDSVFEVASLSKPVATYMALTLVDSGELELDEPVYLLFDKPWLPRSSWGDLITLRYLLTHTSGLSKRLYPIDKSIAFPPGERYSYSNVGFEYVQAVIEQVSGEPLESVAKATVFGPLGMSSSTFADDPRVVSRLVSGHISYGTDLAAVVVALGVCFAVVFALGIAVQWLWKKRIVITWRLLAVFYAVAAFASLPVLAWLNGGYNKWWLFFVIVLAIFSVWVVGWTVVSRLWMRRYSEPWRSGGRLWILRVSSFLSCLVVFALVANFISGPVPKRPFEAPSAAYSLKTTVGDLARFLIELADPERLDPDIAAGMTTPQVEVDESNSRSLGMAVYHGRDNYWVWHSGDNADFHSLMVISPETGDGVVVLANGQNGSLLNGHIARRALGVDFAWSE